MTDTADRTELAEMSALPGLETGDAPAARRRSGSLSSMLLPELQQLDRVGGEECATTVPAHSRPRIMGMLEG